MLVIFLGTGSSNSKHVKHKKLPNPCQSLNLFVFFGRGLELTQVKTNKNPGKDPTLSHQLGQHISAPENDAGGFSRNPLNFDKNMGGQIPSAADSQDFCLFTHMTRYLKRGALYSQCGY